MYIVLYIWIMSQDYKTKAFLENSLSQNSTIIFHLCLVCSTHPIPSGDNTGFVFLA